MLPINIDQFIKDHITLRQESLLQADLAANHDRLQQAIADRSVLVIGGAGTIGSSFIKALLRYQPGKLYVVDINENGLTELTRDVRSSVGLQVPTAYKTYPINFGDPLFAKLLRQEGPFDIVANFAAHKHVRSEKDHYSIEAMIENNVIRTKRLLDLLIEHPPAHFFCVSTDKAANPVNVMGASKKLMEEVLMAYADVLPIKTARFANVAFSNGSLPAGFLERLLKRQPLSSPLDVRRYFVSPEESGQLCLLACMLGKSGDIFFPKLREEQMMTFSAIADALLIALGYEPIRCQTEEEARTTAAAMNGQHREYPVFYFGSDTSGEKLYEEFFTEEEVVEIDRFSALGVIKRSAPWSRQQVAEAFARLEAVFAAKAMNKARIVEVLTDLLPGFQHVEKGKGLDQRM